MTQRWMSFACLAVGLGCGGDGAAPADPDRDATDAATDGVSGGSDTSAPDAEPDAGDTAPDVAGDAPDLAVDGDAADDPDAASGSDDEGMPDAEEADVPRPEGLPDALPFVFTRPEVGAPLTEEEIQEFTREITGLWRDADYFRWVRMTAQGVDPSNAEGSPDYALWWQDTEAVREGDTVTFRHVGRADNLTMRTCMVLSNAIAGYLMTGDEDMRWVVEQYSKGIAALAMATEFGADDPVRYLQSRAPFTRNGDYLTVGGRHVVVDYDPVRRVDDAWNARIVHNPTNPYWGDIWFVNQRSKDDVPHMFRVVPMLRRAIAEAPDPSVVEAATLALEYLEGFARDIVDSDYQIRTKYEDGVAVVPRLENGSVKDLASLVLFEDLIPNAECNGKLGAALIGYGAPLENDCLQGSGGAYEEIAPANHYFNYMIIRYFHIAAVYNALTMHWNDEARELLVGLAARADRLLHDPGMPHRATNNEWESDVAAFLVAAGAAGLPLTHEEARLVRDRYRLSVAHYAAFPYWDPWAESVPEGTFDYVPSRGEDGVWETEITYFLEYCYSPLRNPASAPVIDCAVVRDPSRWGE